MPTLKGIGCSIELANIPLNEHHTRYRDKYVDCHVVAPDSDHPFTIHATSSEYIADGLSVFVFIDGDYQCNRNLPMPPRAVGHTGTSLTPTAEFRLRQREEKLSDGTFVGREWSFASLVTEEDAKRNRHYEKNVGKIEVVFLRCLYKDKEAGSAPKAVLQLSVPKKTQATPAKAPTLKVLPVKALPVKALPAKAHSDKSTSSKVPSFSGLVGLFDGALDMLGSAAVSPFDVGSRTTGKHSTAPLALQPRNYPNTDQLDGSIDDGSFVYVPQGYYQNLYRPSRIPVHRTLNRELGPARNEHAEQQIQVKATQIAYILNEKKALRAIGLDPDALIKLIGRDKKVLSIDFGRMSPQQIQYLLKATKQLTENESDDSSDSSTADSESSKKMKKSSKKANATTGAGWGNESGKHSQKESKKKKKKSKSQKSEQHQDASQETTGSNHEQDSKGWGTQEAPDAGVVSGNAGWGEQQGNAVSGNAGWGEQQGNSAQPAQHEQREQSRSRNDSSSHRSQHSSIRTSTTNVNQKYWSAWDKPAKDRHPTDIRLEGYGTARSPYLYSAPELAAVNSKSHLETDRAVKIGRGAIYDHKSAKPDYIDTMESPYAAFTFRYCSHQSLERILHRNVKDDSVEIGKKAEVQRLMSMTKEDLAAELMRVRLGGALPQVETVAVPQQAGNLKHLDSQTAQRGTMSAKESAAVKITPPAVVEAPVPTAGFKPEPVGATSGATTFW